jgi:hypothetical protein
MNNDDELEITTFPDDPEDRIVSDQENALDSPNSVNCIVTDQLGGVEKRYHIGSEVYSARLVPVLAKKLGNPGNVRYGIQHKQSGRLLRASETLSSVNVKKGDTIRVFPNVRSVESFKYLYFRKNQLVDAILTGGLKKAGNSLKGLFLYSNLDFLTFSYHTDYLASSDSIDYLSRSFFVIGEPCLELKPSFCMKLGTLYEEYADMVGQRLDFGSYIEKEQRQEALCKNFMNHKSFLPLSHESLVVVGDYFGIFADLFPCLFMYEDLSNTTGLVFEINKFIDFEKPNTDQQFQSFFYEVGTCMELAEDLNVVSPLDEVEKEITKWAQKRNRSSHATQKIQMRKSVIEAIALTINLLDQPLGA